jgi:hypothetical protein
LRAVEIADLEWSQVEWGRNPALHVRRAKNGKPAVHPIRGDELRMLRELKRNTTGAFVFETERGGPFTADAVNRLVKTIGARAKLSFGVWRPCSHAAPRLRLRLGQCRPRHAADPGLARPSSNPAHRALYGIKPDTFQGSVALNGRDQTVLRTMQQRIARIGSEIGGQTKSNRAASEGALAGRDRPAARRLAWLGDRRVRFHRHENAA